MGIKKVGVNAEGNLENKKKGDVLGTTEVWEKREQATCGVEKKTERMRVVR